MKLLNYCNNKNGKRKKKPQNACPTCGPIKLPMPTDVFGPLGASFYLVASFIAFVRLSHSLAYCIFRFETLLFSIIVGFDTNSIDACFLTTFQLPAPPRQI